ncbi:hypothetical protein DRO53_01840 [Candidatus Bathyarchaeota archaeon]|nr:MAG: hypothetical protein DRO46_01775 [Candidatus Hecatellales archaeon]RLI35194.1 MAG: hypothetical protein DRO53_01840 [Candidatus Bathyarchaeota archaeon]
MASAMETRFLKVFRGRTSISILNSRKASSPFIRFKGIINFREVELIGGEEGEVEPRGLG